MESKRDVHQVSHFIMNDTLMYVLADAFNYEKLKFCIITIMEIDNVKYVHSYYLSFDAFITSKLIYNYNREDVLRIWKKLISN